MYISIIIPSYNRYDNVIKLLDSLNRQDFDLSKVEVIVISDDPHSNAKYKELEKYPAKYTLKVLYNDTNLGISRARDKGISVSSGKYLLILDDDMSPVDNYLLKAYFEVAEGYKDTLFSGNIIHPKAQNRFQQFINNSSTYFGFKDFNHLDYIPFYRAVSGSIFIPRETLDKHEITFLNNANSEWRYGYEDLIVMYRLNKKGCKFIFNEKAITLHNENYTLQKMMNRKYKAGSKIRGIIRLYPDLKELLKRPGIEYWPISIKIPNSLINLIEKIVNIFRLPDIVIKVLLAIALYSGYKEGGDYS
jgi:GT2 family glycosyltransferase